MNKPWLASYDIAVPPKLDYPDIPLFSFLDEVVKKYPQKTCVTFQNQQITYSEMDILNRAFTRALFVKGVNKGDRVGLMLGNTPQFVMCFFAILRAGGIVVAINPFYKERELLFQLKDSGCKILIAYHQNYPLIKKIQSETSVEQVILTQIGDAARLPGLLEHWIDYEKPDDLEAGDEWMIDLIAENLQSKLEERIVNSIDEAIFQYSGGTTGIPKAAIGLHRNLVANTIQFRTWLIDLVEGEEVVLCAIPLYHVYGMVIAMCMGISLGADLVLIPDPRDIENILSNITRYHATLFPGVPNIYQAINHHPDVMAGRYDLRSIKACISGSAPLLREVKEQFEKLTGGKLIEGYGLSEAPTATHCNPLLGANKEGSIGLPLPDVECRIVNLNDGISVLAPDEIGELIVKGPQVMKSYHNMPEETAKALIDGWLYTGDIARMDAEGYFYLVDRKKDVIKASGFQVWPREIEEVISENHEVREVAVAGVMHPKRGEIVVAWVVIKTDAHLTERDIKTWCRERLVNYKVPADVRFVPSLPRTTVGKVLRRELVREYQLVLRN